MVKHLNTPLFGFLVVLVLSLFLLMKKQSSSLMLVSVVSLVVVYLKRSFAVMIPYLIAFMSPIMLSFKNIVLSRVFSSFLRPLPQSLPFLLIFSSLSILNLWRILRHWLPLQTTHLQFYPQHIICLPVLDPVAPPSLESLVGPELFHSTRVSIPPLYLTDYHCSFALATLYEPYTYCEAHTDPFWQQVMNEELDALHKNHTWDMVDLPPG